MIQHFFNCDWGTSRLRLRLIDIRSGGIVSARSSDQGAAKLAANSTPETRGALFASSLQQHIDEIASAVDAKLDDAPVLISGMASSSMGWCELPYAPLPFSLDGRDLHWRRLDSPEEGSSKEHAKRPIYLCSGIRSDHDVMRGEEVELLGLGILMPDLLQQSQALVILPGTHSKHVNIASGRIVDFQTHMTGELYSLLGSHSSLRHPLQTRDSAASGGSLSADDQVAFREGVELSRQAGLTAALFQVRVRQLLRGSDPSATAAVLSGILIGSELGAIAQQQAMMKQTGNAPVVLCAAEPLSGMYQTAFETLGLSPQVEIVPPADVERLSALGQLAALRHLQPDAFSQNTLGF